MREPNAGGGIGAGQTEQLVEHITASLAEMLARALRQSVEQGVEKALGGAAPKPPGKAAAGAVQPAREENPGTQPVQVQR